MSNLETVQSIYEAFGKGDIPAILAHVAPDAAWESWPDNSAQKRGVPWLKAATGPEGVLEFFTIIGARLEFRQFELQNILVGGNEVVATIKVAITEKTSGASIEDEEIHLWTFNDAGKVARFRHYVDTVKHIAAAGL